MKLQRVKKVLAGSALMTALLLGSGMMLSTTAQADERDRDHRGDWDRREHREHDRYWDHDRFRGGFFFGAPRVYVGPTYYGPAYYNGGGFEGQGYRDGLNRGREDAASGRIFDPNNSEHFREGNAPYRDGFRRGYEIGYRQYRRY